MQNRLALIVEDDPDLRFIAESALKAAGFETEVFADGARALARVGEVVPAMIILDLGLPLISGTHMLLTIKTDDRLAATRVIVTTANAAAAGEVDPAVDLVLLKPYTFSQLRDMARRFLDTPAHAGTVT